MTDTLPKWRDDKDSILKDETKGMERKRRKLEQQGLRALIQARVLERDHPDVVPTGDEPFSELLQHPLLDGQQFDGIENNPPDVNLNPLAKVKLQEAKQKQELKKQLQLEQRLELQNNPYRKYGFNPRPSGP